MVYKLGKINSNADALSRNPIIGKTNYSLASEAMADKLTPTPRHQEFVGSAIVRNVKNKAVEPIFLTHPITDKLDN